MPTPVGGGALLLYAGAMPNAGLWCVVIKRFCVHDSIYDTSLMSSVALYDRRSSRMGGTARLTPRNWSPAQFERVKRIPSRMSLWNG